MLLCVQDNELYFLLCRALGRGYVMVAGFRGLCLCFITCLGCPRGEVCGKWALSGNRNISNASVSIPAQEKQTYFSFPTLIQEPCCNSSPWLPQPPLGESRKIRLSEAVFTRRTFAFALASFHRSRSVSCWWTWPPHPTAFLTGPWPMHRPNRQILGNFCWNHWGFHIITQDYKHKIN